MREISPFLMVGVVFIYMGYLVLPGYITLCLARIRHNRFLLGYGISFSLLVFTQIPIRVVGGSLATWLWVEHISIGILFVVAWIYGHFYRRPSVPKKSSGRRISQYVGFSVVVIGFSLYHLNVGAYTEIPSDFWIHLGDVWNELININKGVLPSHGLDIAGILDGNYVSFLHAVVANLFQSNPLWLVPGATLTSSIIFLGATYWFTLRIISNVRLSREAKVAIATLTTILTVFSFGVSAFSYVRYYAYFHSIFNFPLIYLSLLLLMDYTERPQSSAKRLFLIPVFLITMSLAHKQEALFSLILLSGVAIWRMIRTFQVSKNIPEILWRRTRILGLATITALSLILIYTFLRWDMVWPESSDVVDASIFLPFTRGLPIVNPGLRFWNVLAPFGVVVYLWYFSKRRWFSGIDYINVGMLSPLLTLFNPIFVIWFLHLMTEDVLWRMSYLMPLSLVAAFLIVYSFSDAIKANSRWKLSIAALMTLILTSSLLPFNFRYLYNPHSRLPSLYSIHATNGAGLWEDLIRTVEKISGNRVILADGVTRYVLSNATPHRQGVGGKELWRNKQKLGDLLGTLKRRNYKKGYILVVNRRDGDKSAIGAVSGHWPRDILRVSKHYSLDLDNILKYEINRNKLGFPTGRIELLWANDKISVYKMM
jgi:hypothetical protein